MKNFILFMLGVAIWGVIVNLIVSSFNIQYSLSSFCLGFVTYQFIENWFQFIHGEDA